MLYKERTTRPLEIRSLTDNNDGSHVITGYALKFNQPSMPMPFIEYIDSDALKGVDLSDVKLLYNHDFGNILARTDSNTLTLKVDDVGLFFTATLPDTTLGHDTFENIQNGNLKGCSFGFAIGDEDWSMQGNQAIHTIHQIASIDEISIVALPAYEETNVEIQRSLDRLKGGQSMTEEEQRALKKAEEIRVRQSQSDNNTDKKRAKDTDAKADDKVEDAKDDVAKAEVKKDDVEADKDKRAFATDDKEKRAVASTDSENESDKKDQKITRALAEVDEHVRNLEKHIKKTDEERQVKSNMTIPVGEQKKDKEKRSLEDYIRSHGQKRDGVVSGDVGALIPKEIIYDPSMEVNSVVDLSKVVQTTQVSTAAGTYPILKRATDRMHTVDELVENPALAKPALTNVDWKVATYRAAMPVSEESIADTQTNLMGIIQQNAQEQRVNTLNYMIAQKLETFAAQTIDPSKTPVDDIKNLINVKLDPAYNKSIVMSQSAYQIIDTLKDNEGRYLLQSDITQQGGKTLLGLPVIVVGDGLLGAAGDAKFWIGDLKRAILYADRLDTQIVWEKSEIYGRYLALVMRFDVEVADANAGYFVTLSSGTKPSGTSK